MIQAVLCTMEFIAYAALMAPPKPPKAKAIIARAQEAKNGSDHGSRPIQLNRPVAPFMRPATSSEAMMVKAVTKLGYITENVSTVCASFHPALMPGSVN